MRIAACVLSYRPKEKDLNNLLSYLPKVDKLYIYDNTENIKTTISFENHHKFVYISDYKNKGLSFRLNQACQQAIADGYVSLLHRHHIYLQFS
jgi:rhamnosyltransferase